MIWGDSRHKDDMSLSTSWVALLFPVLLDGVSLSRTILL